MFTFMKTGAQEEDTPRLHMKAESREGCGSLSHPRHPHETQGKQCLMGSFLGEEPLPDSGGAWGPPRLPERLSPLP